MNGEVNDGAILDTSTQYKWRCSGLNGGKNVICSLNKNTTAAQTPVPTKPPIVAPIVLNGKCKSYADGVSSKPDATCASGTVSWVDSSGSDGYYNWKCMGSDSNSSTDDVSCAAKKISAWDEIYDTITDRGCSEKGGKCQSVSDSCEGNYVDGLCVNESRCCMPKVTSM